jgi:hypothetical protein
MTGGRSDDCVAMSWYRSPDGIPSAVGDTSETCFAGRIMPDSSLGRGLLRWLVQLDVNQGHSA